MIHKLIGLSLVLFAIISLGKTFFPILQQEINYNLNKVETFNKSLLRQTTPLDTEFGIVIEKIGANARIVSGVDPYDENKYQKALTEGVAHADGSALPGKKGNIFLFSHSSADLFRASKYNSIFYLLGKMTEGDEVKLYYKDELYTYIVNKKEIVPRSAVEYLTDETKEETLTLMTCWPPGTSMMRLIVQAKRQMPPLP